MAHTTAPVVARWTLACQRAFDACDACDDAAAVSSLVESDSARALLAAVRARVQPIESIVGPLLWAPFGLWMCARCLVCKTSSFEHQRVWWRGAQNPGYDDVRASAAPRAPRLN